MGAAREERGRWRSEQGPAGVPPPLPLSSRLERERGYALDPLRRRRWTLALLVLRWKEKAEQQQQQERQQQQEQQQQQERQQQLEQQQQQLEQQQQLNNN